MRGLLRNTVTSAIALLMTCIAAGDMPEIDLAFASATAGAAPTLMLAGHLGGPTLSVASYQEYTLVGHSHELAVIDLSVPDQPQRIAYLMSPASDIEVVGQLAYAAGSHGLSIVELSDPAHPMIIGRYATEFACAAIDVETDRAYLAASDGLLIVDVSDVQRPHLIKKVALSGRTEDVLADGSLVYAVGSYGVRVMRDDGTILSMEEQVGVTSYAESAVLDGDLLYVAAGSEGLIVLNAADPPHLHVAGSVTTGGYALDVAVRNGMAYVANGLGGTVVVDVRQPDRPAVIGSLPDGRYVLAVDLADDLLLAADRDGGLIVADVAREGRPALLGQLTTPGFISDLAVMDGYAFVVSNVPSGVHVLDVRAPGRIRCIDHIQTMGTAMDVAVDNDRLYIADGYGGLVFYPFDRGRSLAKDASTILTGYVQEVALTADHVLAAGFNCVRVLASAAAPAVQQSIACPGVGPVYRIAVSGNHVFTAGGDAGLFVLDIADAASPRAVAHFAGNAVDVAVADGYAYVAAGREGLHVLDVRAPAQLKPLATLQSEDDISAVRVHNGRLYAIDRKNGLHVYHLTTPGKPVETGRFTTPDLAMAVAVAGEYIYVTDRTGGLFVLQENAPNLAIQPNPSDISAPN